MSKKKSQSADLRSQKMKKPVKKIVYARVKKENHLFLIRSAKESNMTRSKWLDLLFDKIRISGNGSKRGNEIPAEG